MHRREAHTLRYATNGHSYMVKYAEWQHVTRGVVWRTSFTSIVELFPPHATHTSYQFISTSRHAKDLLNFTSACVASRACDPAILIWCYYAITMSSFCVCLCVCVCLCNNSWVDVVVVCIVQFIMTLWYTGVLLSLSWFELLLASSRT